MALEQKDKAKKILITGISGFVGRHFLEFLFLHKVRADILGLDLNEPEYVCSHYLPYLDIDFHVIDLLDIKGLENAIGNFSPEIVLHLASFSSVAYSWQYPVESFKNNTNIFMNLISILQKKAPAARILSVGSSEEYGRIEKEDVPIKERLMLKPISPYAVARVSQEMMSKIYVESYGMCIILTRSFNHIGPWQDERFVIPSFAKRIIKIKKSGRKKGTIRTGDINIIRDFVDVRDVVKAYWMLLEKGTNGEIYNVCSGQGVSLRQVIEIMAEELEVQIDTETDPELIRPNDNPIIIGENYKIFSEIGWKPEIELRTTIKDLISDMNNVQG